MPNSKVLESKKAIVDALTQKLQTSTAAVFVDYKGITVAKDTELRNQCREAGVEYTYTYIIKNFTTDEEMLQMYELRPDAFSEDEIGRASCRERV